MRLIQNPIKANADRNPIKIYAYRNGEFVYHDFKISYKRFESANTKFEHERSLNMLLNIFLYALTATKTCKPSQFFLLHLLVLNVHIRFNSLCELSKIFFKERFLTIL